MSEALVFEQVEPFAGDTPETVCYRSCDWCYETAVEDIWAKREWRRFYRVSPGCEIVCDGCLAGLEVSALFPGA